MVGGQERGWRLSSIDKSPEIYGLETAAGIVHGRNILQILPSGAGTRPGPRRRFTLNCLKEIYRLLSIGFNYYFN